MNIKTIAVAILAPVLTTVGANANTIEFRGEVASQTCKIAVKGQGETAVLLLPTVAIGQFSAIGNVAGLTPFTLDVTECQAAGLDGKQLSVRFVGSQIDAQGNLLNSGTAEGVALQLLESPTATTAIQLSASGKVVNGPMLAANGKTASHDFAVRYVSLASNAKAGTVRAGVQYALTYQ